MTIDRHVAAAAERLLAASWPEGVSAERTAEGIALSAKALHHRFATEPGLRATVQRGERR